jgi:Ala-tRNA(Pro) deacylase
MTECESNNIGGGTKRSSYNLCIVHNPPFDGKSYYTDDGNTKLNFLIEQRDKCLNKLEELAIAGHFAHQYHVYHHAPVYTCEDVSNLCPKIDEGLKCGEMKNLFLVDKGKKTLYLISAFFNTDVNLKAIAKLVGAKELRFANEVQLKENLNLIPGSVTPFGLMNDKECLVKYFLEKKAIDTCEYFGFHPNSCISTIAMHKDDLLKMIQDPSIGNHTVNILDI